MNQNNFLSFLEENHYDKIYKSIVNFCKGNKDLLIDSSRANINYISYIEEEDIDLEFKQVYIDDKDDKIEFDIVIEVDVPFIGVTGKHHDRDTYSARIWVALFCSGTMQNRLKDFKIFGSEEYSRTKPKKPLSGDLVPIIPREKYDEYAEEILSKYYPEALTRPMKIDVDILAKNMGLNIVNTSISKDKGIYGVVFFDDTILEVYDKTNDKKIEKEIKQNTILVDDEAAYLRSFGSRSMTIAHECVHAYYHRKAFQFAQMFDSKLKFIQCKVTGVMRNNNNFSSTEWMEIQANGIAPFILMPRVPFVQAIKKSFEEVNSFADGSISDVIQLLSDTFGVTIYAARKRMIDCGYDAAIGAFNWVDDHYVRPYKFKKGSLEHNETFTVSYKDVYLKVLENKQLFPQIITGKYVFVENHLCINNDLYVEKNTSGDLILSEYALHHMDECCVKFKYRSKNGFNESTDFGLMCYLCRDCSKEIEFDLTIQNDPAGILSDDQLNIKFKIHQENVKEVVSAITNKPFHECLDYLMNYLDIQNNELEIDSGLNERTIRRYRNGENKSPEKRTVIALIRALNVPHPISNVLIKQAGIAFVSGNDEDSALLTVLTSYRNASIRQANNFLIKLGYESLT